jgi:hypothetical protein
VTRSAACATCCFITITTRHTRRGSSVMLPFDPYPQRRSSTRRTGCVLLCGRRRGRRHAVLGQISFCVSVVCSKLRVTSRCTCQGGCMIYDIVNDSPLVRQWTSTQATIKMSFKPPSVSPAVRGYVSQKNLPAIHHHTFNLDVCPITNNSSLTTRRKITKRNDTHPRASHNLPWLL